MTLARGLLRVARKPRGVRASYERLKRRNLPDPPPAVARRHRVETAETGGTRCVWLDQDRAPAGTIAYLHGGSYVTGPERAQWTWFSRLCREAGAAGLLVDYALTPEHAYPVALEQTLAAVPQAPWVLAGDSAGGGLALAVAYRLRDEGRPLPAGLLLSSPWLDITMSNPQARANQRIDPMLSLRGLARGAEPYAGTADARDPHLSPLFGDPAGLPPMQIEVGTRELFLWDNRAWAAKCAEAGTACDLVETDGGFHDFALAVGLVPEAAPALRRQAAFARARLTADRPASSSSR